MHGYNPEDEKAVDSNDVDPSIFEDGTSLGPDPVEPQGEQPLGSNSLTPAIPGAFSSGAMISNVLGLQSVPAFQFQLPLVKPQKKEARVIPTDTRTALRAKFIKAINGAINKSDKDVSSEFNEWFKDHLNAQIAEIVTAVENTINTHSKLGNAAWGGGASKNFALELAKIRSHYSDLFRAYEQEVMEWIRITGSLYDKLDELSAYDPQVVTAKETALKLAREAANSKQAEVNALVEKLQQAQTNQTEMLRLSRELGTAVTQLQIKNEEQDRMKTELESLKAEQSKIGDKDITIATLKAKLEAADQRSQYLEVQLKERQDRANRLEQEVFKANDTIRATTHEYAQRLQKESPLDVTVVSEEAETPKKAEPPKPPVPRTTPTTHGTSVKKYVTNPNAFAAGKRSQPAPTANVSFSAIKAQEAAFQLKPSQKELSAPNQGKIKSALEELRRLQKVSELRIATIEELARFLSHFEPSKDDTNTKGTQLSPECVTVCEAFKQVVTGDKNPKDAIDAILSDLKSLETCSDEGKALFGALINDLQTLQRRSARDNGVEENLGHVDVLGQILNLTMSSRFDIPALNLHFKTLWEAAKKERETATTPTPVSAVSDLFG